MADRKWGAIASGATFEALATTIVFFEDPKAALFGRRGPDGGQDARSGDGTRVFQAKYHENGSAARAIADAKREAKKISAYRQPGHSRYDQWKGVTHWWLVTNAPFNPTDKQTWDNDVVPLFADQGLSADYWERENLNALLDKHPEIHRSFFENETRAFLSVPEVRERLPGEEPFLRRAELGRFFGREAELGKVRDFLGSNNLFLVVHGAGGMGKTRLLVEAGEDIASDGDWQVLWANVASMAATGAWFEGVVPERPTLLLVDEPPDEAVLQQLAEQLGGRVGRVAQWKVAVAVRSTNDPVLRFLRGPRMRPRVRELPIASLQESEAEAMCEDLLGSGVLSAMPEEERRDAARKLSRRFARYPVWLTLAVHVLEDRGALSMLPTTAKDLADDYLGEIERSQKESPPEQVRALLRWVALIGTVNRSDDATVKLIGDESGTGDVVEVRRKLAGLVGRRALIERGARNRFVELKPDVLRDHVLLGWLTVNVGFGEHPIVPSEEAIALVKKVQDAVVAGPLSGLGRRILVSLARTEFLLRRSEHDVPLLADFFKRLRVASTTLTASHRLALAEVLEGIAEFQPIATADVISVMRQSVAPEETIEGIFGARVLGQNDVLLALAWPLFHAAMGAQTAEAQEVVLRELCALTEAEGDLAPRLERGLPNNGERAAALIERVLEGGPQFWGDFDSTAKTLGEEVLGDLSRRPPTLGKWALLKALVRPAIAVERRQTWMDGHVIHIKTFAIGPDHPAWETRNALLSRIKDALSAEATPVESRVALWHVFAEAHNNINQMCRMGDPKDERYFDALLSDLLWAREALEHRGASLEELSASRKLWDWHYRFESDPQLKQVSEQLEALYTTNELATEFEPLLSLDDLEQRGPRGVAKAAELAAARSPDDVSAFVDRAVAFLGTEKELYQLMGVAWALGTHAETQAVVQLFVKASLGQPVVTPRGDFGAFAAASWVASVRTSDRADRTRRLVSELMASCGSDDQRANLLLQIYGHIPRRTDIGELSPDEHELLRAQKRLFLQSGRGPEFVAAMALTLDHDWPSLKSLLEDVLQALAPAERPATLRGLINGVYWAVRKSDPVRLPTGLATWLLDQLLLIPDFNDLGNNEWHLEEILKRVGRVHVSWLPGALAARSALAAKQDQETRVRPLSHHFRFSKYVRRIVATDVDDRNVMEGVDALLDFSDDNGSVGYHLPEVLRDVDPEGLVIPAAVVERLQRASEAEQVGHLARIGGAYGVGSPPWRRIAKAAIASGLTKGAEARRSIFSALANHGIQSWSGKPGEVPALFVSAVQRAKAALESEADVELRPFWEWRLASAEAELRDEEERAKEERGE